MYSQPWLQTNGCLCNSKNSPEKLIHTNYLMVSLKTQSHEKISIIGSYALLSFGGCSAGEGGLNSIY